MNDISAAELLRIEVTELAAELAPRRFALCWIDAEEDDGGVLGWGFQIDDDLAVVCGTSDGGVLARCSSAEQAGRLLSRSQEVTVVWLDGVRHDER
ncbi:hypothetical protein E1281_25685 [Actinomadura sp. KC345]|uniref:hypothetical protein n=1 Tax=Actinomadura sp. KC345 TaxID=2530371 RepID=UPI00105093CD|nr:hypothetical protein [Actinomadura sp. KC345]TDC47811.1 hypothetical protein E1281_25685 [Actinomadura sp. KC345]